MKSASLSEIKKELHTLSLSKLAELCLRLAKYKKENKELLTYLLFDAADESLYCASVKELTDTSFKELPRYNLYQTVKGIRKVLRTTKKFVKYSGQKQTEAELLLYFLGKLKAESEKVKSSPVIAKLYLTQTNQIRKVIGALHEDLQYDYTQELNKL